MFGVFMVSWVFARHIFYLMVCWSIYAHTPDLIPGGCFEGSAKTLTGPNDTPADYAYLIEPFLNPEGRVCFTPAVRWAFLGSLLALQVLTILWFFMIVRVAVRVVSGGSAEDVRSDDEGGEKHEDGEVEVLEPLEEEVGVEDLDLKGWERRKRVKRQATSSGVSLPGHSDRKELLGRIGCEKQVD